MPNSNSLSRGAAQTPASATSKPGLGREARAALLRVSIGPKCPDCNLWVFIIYLFFLPVMLPSVLPRLATNSAVRVFPGVWKLLSFQESLPGAELHPYLFCLFFCLLYFFLPPLDDNGLLFWVPDVLCWHSEVVLWNLLSI